MAKAVGTQRLPGVISAALPKPRPSPPPALARGIPILDAKPIPRAELNASLERTRHAGCISHVEVDGLRKPVCVRRGQDPERVVAEALELAGD